MLHKYILSLQKFQSYCHIRIFGEFENEEHSKLSRIGTLEIADSGEISVVINGQWKSYSKSSDIDCLTNEFIRISLETLKWTEYWFSGPRAPELFSTHVFI